MGIEQRRTVLLMDDNPQIRSFIRTALEDGGFNCLEAADGDEALYHAEAGHPDLIVLDILAMVGGAICGWETTSIYPICVGVSVF